MREDQRAEVLALFDDWPHARERLAAGAASPLRDLRCHPPRPRGRMVEGAFDSDFSGRGAPAEWQLPHAYLSFVAVHPSERRRGVGAALVRAFALTASARGCTFLAALPADHDDDQAARIAFFSACGLWVLTPPQKLMGAPGKDLLQDPRWR